MKKLNKKKKFVLLISLILVVFVLFVLVFKTDFFGRLLGQIISSNTETMEQVKTGVIVDNNYSINLDGEEYKKNGYIPIDIYNGAESEIIINKVFVAINEGDYQDTDDESVANDYYIQREKKQIPLDAPVVIAPDSTYVYHFSNFQIKYDALFYDVLFEYELADKNYVIGVRQNVYFSSRMEPFTTEINGNRSKKEDPKIFSFSSELGNVEVSLSNKSIFMDISENLEDVGLTYSVNTNSDALWNFYHPQSTNALTKDMFGNPNSSNVRNYFTFTNPTNVIKKQGALSNETFTLQGKPNGIYTDEEVVLGAYFTSQISERVLSSEANYSSSDLPSFKLTTYDKSSFKKSLERAFEKLLSFRTSDITISELWSSDKIQTVTDAIGLLNEPEEYETADGQTIKVTQEEIDRVKALLDDIADIKSKPRADYTKLDKIRQNALSINRSWYKEESLNALDEQLNRYKPGLSNTYQVMIDNITKKLQNAYDNLELKPALGYLDADNYKPFEGAISVETFIRDLKNLDENIYTKDAIDKALLEVKFFEENQNGIMDKKINQQESMDELLSYIYNFKNSLDKKLGNYNELCKHYKEALKIHTDYYLNIDELNEVLANINWNLKIDEQDKIDEETRVLKEKLDNLVMKDAKYDEFNKIYEQASKLNSNYYSDFSKVSEILKKMDSLRNLKIDRQDDVDTVTNELKQAVKNLNMKNANYNAINSLKLKIEQLNKNKYLNFNIVQNALDKIVYGKKIDEQLIVDAMYNELYNAYKGLIEDKADYSELTKALSKIPNDYSIYDENSQKSIIKVLAEAKALPNDLTSKEQYKIDNLVKKINDLLSGLNIEKQEDESTDVIISYLKVNGNKVDISKTPFKCTVTYDTVEASVDVGLVSKDSSYKVYGGSVLLTGENTIRIVVTLKNGDVYTYNLIITRKETSNYLSGLKISNTKIDFSKDKKEYTIKIDKNTNKLDLSVITEDENSKVTIKGNNNLKNGSKVLIEVEDKDGNLRVYTLNIQKAGSVDVKVIIVLIMILIILAGIFKYIKDKKDETKNNNA